MPPAPADKLRPAEMRCSILSKYTGIPCSRCGHTFTDQDDVVVCPECGAPHHRSCFRELGHCALQEQHGPDFSWSYHSAQPESEGTSQTVICSRCGAATPAELPNCQMCGSPLSADAQEPPPLPGQGQYARHSASNFETYFDDWEYDGVTAREFSAYTGTGSYYFLNQFKRLVHSRQNISWNWCAFFFGFLYFFYRKMYRLGAALLAFYIASSLPTMLCFFIGPFDQQMVFYGMQVSYNAQLLDQLAMLGNIMGFAQWALMILCGLFANKFYLQTALRTITQFRQGRQNDPQYYTDLYLLGRPNPLIIALLFAAFFITTGFLGTFMQIVPVA